MAESTLPFSGSPFSLVSGGAAVRALRRRGSRFPDRLGAVSRAAAALALLTWLPLALATLLEDNAVGWRGAFASDVGVHVRFLLALPLAVVAELPVGRRLARAILNLADAGLIDDANRERARAAIARAERMRDATWIEAALAGLSLGLSLVDLVFARHRPATWILTPDGTPTIAGLIYLFFAAPLFRFVVLRWLWRLIVWATLLSGLARAPLRIDAAHPDRAGGLSVLSGAHQAFAWVALALGISLAGNLSTEKLALGRSVTDYTTELIAFSLVTPLVFLAPLLVFAIPIELARRERHAHYASASADFARRWAGEVLDPETRSPMAADTATTSAHADLVTSFEAVRGTAPLLITKRLYLALLAASALPMIAFAAQEIPLLVLLRRIRDTIG